MRSVKLLITLLLVTLSLSKGIAQSYVQPMRYDHYSFTQQVNIGVGTVRTTAPSAYLEVGPTSGATKGFLPPRLSTTQRDGISSPAAGLFIYNSTTNKYNYFNGVSWGEISNEYVDSLRLSGLNLQARKNGNWYTQFALTPYTDTIWREPGKDSIFWRKNGISYAIKDSGGVSMSQISDSLNGYWRQTGNNITYGKYIGTNNDFDLRFFTNGTERMRIDSASGEVNIGTTTDAGDFKLQTKGNVLSIYASDDNLSSALIGNQLVLQNSYASGYNVRIFADYSYHPSFGFAVKAGNTKSEMTNGTGWQNIMEYGGAGYNFISYYSSLNFMYGTTERVKIGTFNPEMVINDIGDNYDFRIEGDTEPHLFFTDASADKVYLGGNGYDMGFQVQVHGGLGVSDNSTFYGNLSVFGTLSTSTVSQAGGAMTWNIISSLDRNLTFDDGGTLGAKDLIRFFSGDTYGNITSGDGNILIVNPAINQSSGAGNIIGYRFKPTVTAAYSKIYSVYADTGMVYIDDKVGIKTANPDSTLHVVGGFKLVNGTQGAGKVLTSDANGGASWQTPPAGLTLDEGSYTPTLTNTTNIWSSTATTTYWFRVGDRIYVFGQVEIDATSAGTLSEMGLTLPISSTISNESDLAGTAVHEDGTPIRIMGDTVNGRAKFKFTPNTATANKYSFHFSYLYVAP